MPALSAPSRQTGIVVGRTAAVAIAGGTFAVSSADPGGGYTGYYRPEDMDLDPISAADGTRRMCWNDTGNDQAQQWGETMCLTDTGPHGDIRTRQDLSPVNSADPSRGGGARARAG